MSYHLLFVTHNDDCDDLKRLKILSNRLFHLEPVRFPMTNKAQSKELFFLIEIKQNKSNSPQNTIREINDAINYSKFWAYQTR